MSIEQHWAVAMKKAQQKTTRQTVPLEARKEQIKEEVKHFKNELKKIYPPEADQPAAGIERLLKAIFELRAEQALIKLQEFKNKYGFADENIAKKETRAYFHDCRRLLKAIRKNSS